MHVPTAVVLCVASTFTRRRYMAGGTRLDDYVTHTMKFDQINEAFDLLHAGKCLRVVLTV